MRYGNQGRAKDIIILFWIFHGDFNVKCLSPLIAPNSVCVRGVQISIIKFKIFTLAPLYDNRCSIAADVDILKIFSRNVLVHFFRPILRECFKTDRIIFCTRYQFTQLRRDRETEFQRLCLIGAKVALRVGVAAVVIEIQRQYGGICRVVSATQYRSGRGLVVGDGPGLYRVPGEHRRGAHSLAGGVEEAVKKGVVVFVLWRDLGVGVAGDAVDDDIAVLFLVVPDSAAGEKQEQC